MGSHIDRRCSPALRFAGLVVATTCAACGSSGGAVPPGMVFDGSPGVPGDASVVTDSGSATDAIGALADGAEAETPAFDATVDASAKDAPVEAPAPEGGDAAGMPSVADNPPVPAGYKLMMQSEVTPDMTAWAASILDDPTDYPMFSSTTMTFGSVTVLARVEWHPPDFQNSVVHRGVTLYEPV